MLGISSQDFFRKNFWLSDFFSFQNFYSREFRAENFPIDNLASKNIILQFWVRISSSEILEMQESSFRPGAWSFRSELPYAVISQLEIKYKQKIDEI